VGVAALTVVDEMPVPQDEDEYLGGLPYGDDDEDMDIGGGVGMDVDLGSNRSQNEGKTLFS
jgi:hypothetical protein